MAPVNQTRNEREKKLKSLLTFASRLLARLTSPTDDPTILDDLRTHLRSLPLPPSSTSAAKQEELDARGTELWNLSIRLRRDQVDADANSNRLAEENIVKRTVCLLRVFAFFLLDAAGAQANKRKDGKNCIRLVRVALKTAKTCLDRKELDCATKVLERVAELQESLGKGKHISDDEGEVGERLKMEYFVFRTALAWRQDRMDTAEHMFMKGKQVICDLDPSTAEALADLLYEMGKDLLGKRSYESAAKWLKRADDILGDQELERLSPDAGELRLSIIQSLVQAYMTIRTSESLNRAWELVKLLESDYGDKMIVQLLKLELLSSTEIMDIDQYYRTLLRMIRSVVLTANTFKTIMHHVHKLKDKSTTTACKILDELLELRLFSAEDQIWTEKAVITRTWLSTQSSQSSSSDDNLEGLQILFDSVSQNTKVPFGAPATHAAQTLLWKKVEAAYNLQLYAVGESWCRLSMHPLFGKAGESNKAKIARKTMLCSLARHDCATARAVFLKMSETARAESLSRFLMYRVALKDNDEALPVTECLDIICRQSNHDPTLLYACVLEAQSAGDKRHTVLALKGLLDHFQHGIPSGIHIPALFRCTIKLLAGELVESGSINQHTADEVVKVFEAAESHSKASRRRPPPPTAQQFTTTEFEWFSRNAYNLSLKYSAEMHPQCLVRLLKTCIQFIILLKDQDQVQTEQNEDLPLRMMFCHFLSACAFATLARAEDSVQASLQHYLSVRRHGQSYRSIASEQLEGETRGDAAKTDAISKHLQIIKLELEAALKLEDWDSIDNLLDECWKYENPTHLETLADLVLIIHSHIVKANLDAKYQTKIFATLQKIINLTYRSQTPSSSKSLQTLARWIRCLFQLAVSFDETISLACLQQATDIACLRQGEPDPYPQVELEWLATTSFNRAVDCYVAGDDKGCRVWAEKALGLAGWTEDGPNGALKRCLLEKYSGLVWEGNT